MTISNRSWKPDALALLALYAFTAMAVAGYAVFGLHPERLPRTDFAIALFTRSFEIFGRLHVLLSALVLGFVLLRRARFAWAGAFAAVYVLSFSAEFLGTGRGVPFGGYAYSGLLGPKLGSVPALIPLSWFVMAAASYGLARAAFPGSAWRRVTLATALLVVWDLSLDPAMSYLTPYWSWQDTGPFYGMPWVNLWGWTLTGLVLMTAVEALGGGWVERVRPAWWAGFYGAVLLMPLGMVVAGGLWWAALATLAGLGLCGLVASLPERATHGVSLSVPEGRLS